MPDIQKLLAKVAHLRALAARAGTQAEAEAAAAAADKILTEHRLHEVEIPTGEEPCERHEPLDAMRSYSAWKGILAYSLAKHYGCYMYRERTWQKQSFPIFGRKSDAEIVRYMYAWLVLEIDRLASREHGKAAKNAFRLGAVSGYLATLRTSAAQASKGHESAALVLVSRAKEAEELAKGGRDFGRARSSSPTDASAYMRGRAAGSGLGKTALPQGVRGLLK